MKHKMAKSAIYGFAALMFALTLLANIPGSASAQDVGTSGPPPYTGYRFVLNSTQDGLTAEPVWSTASWSEMSVYYGVDPKHEKYAHFILNGLGKAVTPEKLGQPCADSAGICSTSRTAWICNIYGVWDVYTTWDPEVTQCFSDTVICPLGTSYPGCGDYCFTPDGTGWAVAVGKTIACPVAVPAPAVTVLSVLTPVPPTVTPIPTAVPPIPATPVPTPAALPQREKDNSDTLGNLLAFGLLLAVAAVVAAFILRRRAQADEVSVPEDEPIEPILQDVGPEDYIDEFVEEAEPYELADEVFAAENLEDFEGDE